MKKFIGLLLLVCLFSCEKDSSSKYSKDIVGSWQLTSGEPASHFDSCDFQGYITFKTDNTLLDIDACEYINSTGLWRITENILTISNDDNGIAVDILILSISDTKMQLKYMGDIENYTKVPYSQVKPVTARCKFCKQVTYENGVVKVTGTEVQYCGINLVTIEATPEIRIGTLTVKYECR